MNRDCRAESRANLAGKGSGTAMMMLSGMLRDSGEREKAEQWIEKAAETGDWRAVQEMIGIAESDGDLNNVVSWLTVAMLRAPDPATAYRCRMTLAM